MAQLLIKSVNDKYVPVAGVHEKDVNMVSAPILIDETPMQYTACSYSLEVPENMRNTSDVIIYINLPDYGFQFWDNGRQTCQFIQCCKNLFPQTELENSKYNVSFYTIESQILDEYDNYHISIEWEIVSDESISESTFQLDEDILNWSENLNEDRIHIFGKFSLMPNQRHIYFSFNYICELSPDNLIIFPTYRYISTKDIDITNNNSNNNIISLSHHCLISINSSKYYGTMNAGYTPEELYKQMKTYQSSGSMSSIVYHSLSLTSLYTSLPSYIKTQAKMSIDCIRMKTINYIAGRPDFYVQIQC
ncbi:hypothetical protein WA158_008041 [Blastocystis sp. Blastoise]